MSYVKKTWHSRYQIECSGVQTYRQAPWICLRDSRRRLAARPADDIRGVCRSEIGILRDAKQLVVTPEVTPVDIDRYPPFEEWTQCPGLLDGGEGSGLLERGNTNGARSANRLKVAMLLSGGVDSSLALHLLSAAGHDVTAFYLQIWFQEDFRNFWDSCPWEEDLKYCTQVCDRLGVPLKVVPLTNEYWDKVVTHCIKETKAGRTPNPDILCNSRIKFGAFFDYLNSQEEDNFDRIASGHYARVKRTFSSVDGNEIEETHLVLTPDDVKDQTYFLAHLTQDQLKRCMFPIGKFTKSQVRGLATAANLPNQARPDSQGLCFLGKVRFSEFIKEHLGEWPGPIVEEETNQVVGYHKGFWFHTIGQRKGLRLAGGPWYVTSKDPRSNVVYVSRQYDEIDTSISSNRSRSSLRCTNFNWNSSSRPDPDQELFCKVRHGPNMYRCTLEVEGNGLHENTEGYVELDGIDQGLADGQFVVFYQNNICLGCAVIRN